MGDDSEAGIALVQKDNYFLSFTLRKDKAGMRIEVVHKNKKKNTLKSHKIKSYKGVIKLKLVSSNDQYIFSYATKGKAYKKLITTAADLVLFSGFTGAHIGPYATSNGQNNLDYADFDWVKYVPRPRK